MPRNPDTPCTVCGKLCWPSLPTKRHPGWTPPPHVCRRCRGVSPASRSQRTCSDCGANCQGQRCRSCHLAAGTTKRVCVACDEPFVAKESAQRCCSRECARFVRAGVWPSCELPRCACGQLIPRGNWVCGQCRKPGYQRTSGTWETVVCIGSAHQAELVNEGLSAFTPVTITRKRVVGRQPDRLCSTCVTDRQRRRNKERLRSHRKRAEKYGCVIEPVNKRLVFERDNWVCQLCDEAVDPKRKWPDQMCASLDHVIPLSLGGPHSMSNLRLAHWLCNCLRGTDDIDFRLSPTVGEGGSSLYEVA